MKTIQICSATDNLNTRSKPERKLLHTVAAVCIPAVICGFAADTFIKRKHLKSNLSFISKRFSPEITKKFFGYLEQFKKRSQLKITNIFINDFKNQDNKTKDVIELFTESLRKFTKKIKK